MQGVLKPSMKNQSRCHKWNQYLLVRESSGELYRLPFVLWCFFKIPLLEICQIFVIKETFHWQSSVFWVRVFIFINVLSLLMVIFSGNSKLFELLVPRAWCLYIGLLLRSDLCSLLETISVLTTSPWLNVKFFRTLYVILNFDLTNI